MKIAFPRSNWEKGIIKLVKAMDPETTTPDNWGGIYKLSKTKLITFEVPDLTMPVCIVEARKGEEVGPDVRSVVKYSRCILDRENIINHILHNYAAYLSNLRKADAIYLRICWCIDDDYDWNIDNKRRIYMPVPCSKSYCDIISEEDLNKIKEWAQDTYNRLVACLVQRIQKAPGTISMNFPYCRVVHYRTKTHGDLHNAGQRLYNGLIKVTLKEVEEGKETKRRNYQFYKEVVGNSPIYVKKKDFIPF